MRLWTLRTTSRTCATSRSTTAVPWATSPAPASARRRTSFRIPRSRSSWRLFLQELQHLVEELHMSDVRVFAPGGYRFINAVFQYSGGVAAEPGHRIVRV